MGHNKNHKPEKMSDAEWKEYLAKDGKPKQYGGEGAKIMHCGPGHQVGGGTFLSKHCASSNYKDKPAGGYQPLNYMSASYNDMGDSNKPKGKIAQKGAKPDYLDFDKDGDKNEPMKQALEQKK